MATWHQNKSKAVLSDETRWSLVVDPPNQMRYCILFDTEQAAYAAWQKQIELTPAYVLSPRPFPRTTKGK